MNKRLVLVVLSTVLLLALTLNSYSFGVASANIMPAPPINPVYINADGTITPQTAPITQHGNVYTFTGDIINSTLVVYLDNIVIDGAGFEFRGYTTHRYTGIDISNRTQIIIKNAAINAFLIGVEMDNAQNCQIINNTMVAFTGVDFIQSNNNIVEGNSFSDGYGVKGTGSNNTVTRNTFNSGLFGGGNGMGIYVGGEYNLYSFNNMEEELSIHLYKSAYCTVANNTINKGQTGIILAHSSHNIIYGNTLTNKLDSRNGAMYISEYSTNNSVYKNQFQNNALSISLGIQIADTFYNDVTGNHIYQNNFVNNTLNVWISRGAPINYWDNGFEGNYWSDFSGLDTNDDGISETAYSIAENNIDHYPLMSQIDLSTYTSQAATSNQNPTPTSMNTPENQVTPEIETWIILPLFALILAAALIYIKNKKKKIKNSYPSNFCLAAANS